MGMTGVAAAAWAWLVVVSSGAILVPDHPVNALSLLLATVAVNTNTPASFSLSVISPTSNCTASLRSTG